MKKINYYIVGVTAFSALMLLLVVAMFVGLGPKLRNSQPLKNYIEGLEFLADGTERQNDRLSEQLTTADCQLVWDKLDQLHSDAKVLWFRIGSSYGSTLTSEGLLGKTTVNLPELFGKNSSRIEQLVDERAAMIRQKLVGCINE